MASQNSFNIANLYQKVFGLKGVRFAIPETDVLGNVAKSAVNFAANAATFAAGQLVNKALRTNENQKQLYDGIETIPLPASSIKSALGTPIYEQIALTIPAIINAGVVTAPQKIYTFPDWPLFDITGQDIITKTMMTKKKGSVKEYITEDDYSITIRGILINYDSQEYPEQQLQDLMQIIKCKKAMSVTSQVLNLMDIHSLVIERANWPSSEGFQNIQPFELECLSDEPAELEIKSVKTKKPIIQGL
ncbi:DUF6046 domain-containing protein [Mucilaginibacter sp. 5C4]|uniref:DUF6046 domain-containing protein n=1 Tax=Mucilaginibacter sp. 5C4 TaxID=3048589 RepID=UPI002AC913C8|nr:DUF6046 domain-containing protein [Mucilaginibacter sp. 5C4]MEB0302392.1 DUF6046 domain-containing protein [Mucilaginibacter sp. 5C4]WPX22958.1 DUF6046 domain-containing protein [Mucilaginibacter sp. 5C4]